MALYIFSGKGGVGKTHLATSLSFYLSQTKKRRVLQVEFNPLKLYSVFFSMPEVSFKAQAYQDRFFVSSWDGFDCLKEYATSVLHSESLADYFLKQKVVQSLIGAAPGLREIAVLGKLTSDYRDKISIKSNFDDIVFDAPASGHFASLLKVPFALKNTVGVGPMKTQCEDIISALQKSKEVKSYIVSENSPLPLQESRELIENLREAFGAELYLEELKNKVSNTNEHKSVPELYHPEGWLKSAELLSSHWENLLDG